MKPHDDKKLGLLLVGHGTRNAAGQVEMLEAGAAVAGEIDMPLETGFLELAEPTIDQAIDRLHERDVRQLVVMPLLLFAAGHAKRDIPAAVAESAARFDGLAVGPQTDVLACHPDLIELSAQRFEEALADRPSIPAEQTHLVMVGRGSHDKDAIAAMNRLTELRRQRIPCRSAETCFLSMASPSLTDTLKKWVDEFRAANADMPRRIVVQPHLLFQGDLLATLSSRVGEAAAETPAIDWIVTGHLGPHPFLVRAIRDLVTVSLRAGVELS